MKITWTIPASKELRKIYNFYKKKASVEVAQSIKDKIFQSTSQLESFKHSAQKEELLKDRKDDYRSLVSGYFKVIYKVNPKEIYIVDVFDCRQYPDKIKRGK
jgi:plasmid stabilization system protein ParE